MKSAQRRGYRVVSMSLRFGVRAHAGSKSDLARQL